MVNLQEKHTPCQKEFPKLPSPRSTGESRIYTPSDRESVGFRAGPGEQQCKKLEKQELCSSARKIIGLSPIEPRMLELQMQSYGARNIEEAKLMEVKSYLKCEMKLRSADIQKLNIVNIFPPAKEKWNVLYRVTQ